MQKPGSIWFRVRHTPNVNIEFANTIPMTLANDLTAATTDSRLYPGHIPLETCLASPFQ
jgi:hypothetical protein